MCESPSSVERCARRGGADGALRFIAFSRRRLHAETRGCRVVRNKWKFLEGRFAPWKDNFWPSGLMKRKKWSVFFGAIRRELRPECLGLDYDKPSKFCKSQVRCAYFYRLIFFAQGEDYNQSSQKLAKIVNEGINYIKAWFWITALSTKILVRIIIFLVQYF